MEREGDAAAGGLVGVDEGGDENPDEGGGGEAEPVGGGLEALLAPGIEADGNGAVFEHGGERIPCAAVFDQRGRGGKGREKGVNHGPIQQKACLRVSRCITNDKHGKNRMAG